MTNALPEPEGSLCCPVCGSTAFDEFNGRINARCTGCKSVERARLLWLVLEREGLVRSGLRILHLAPEFGFAKRFAELSGDRYHACDLDVARYTKLFGVVHPIDLCSDLVKLPSRSFDLIIHSHVLEHVKCDVESVLVELERLLAPGGHQFLSVPIRGEVTREDLSDDLLPEHRAMMFGQHDHYRIFGAKSLVELLQRVWGPGQDYLVRPSALFTREELSRAAIPEVAFDGMSSHSIFHHVRSSYVEVTSQSEPVRASLPVAESVPRLDRARARLLLHIGMPKTGTTALQSSLTAHRATLREAGLEYWSAAENHSELMFFAFADAERIAQARMWFQRQSEPVTRRAVRKEEARSAFDGFIDELAGKIGVISAEALWTFAASEVRSLAEQLAQRSVSVTVLCGLRRPVEYMTSAVQQACRSALSLSKVANGLEREIPLKYSRLDAWLESFGKSAVVTWPHGENVVRDFERALEGQGIEITLPAEQAVHNPSLSLTAAKALLALNEGRGRAPERARSKLLGQVLRKLDGGPFALPESAVKRLQKLFAAENTYLARRLGLSDEYLHRPSAAVDDVKFYEWGSDEVVTLLSALDAALAELEAKSSSRALDRSGSD